MKKIKNENDYMNVMQEIESLQKNKTAAAQKKLKDLNKLIEDYEGGQSFKEQMQLEALQDEMAAYSEEEIKVFSVMAIKIIEYQKQKQAGDDVKFPKFDPELFEEMREWARLKAEINKLETKIKK